MKRLDRALQLELLTLICEKYPLPLLPKSGIDFDEPVVQRNLMYLKEHGLIELRAQMTNDAQTFWISFAKATHAGMDFMEQDGGLSAILNVQTVRLHDDTIRQLLEARVMASNLPTAERESLLARLRQLPAKAVEQLAEKLLDQALEKAPDAIEWISTLASSAR